MHESKHSLLGQFFCSGDSWVSHRLRQRSPLSSIQLFIYVRAV